MRLEQRSSSITGRLGRQGRGIPHSSPQRFVLSVETPHLCSDYCGVNGLKIDLQGAGRWVTLCEVYKHLSLPVVAVPALENVLNFYHDVRADKKAHGEYRESTTPPAQLNA
jgi:hypothetical protein